MAIVQHSKDYVIIIIRKKMICTTIKPPPLSSSLQPKFDIGKGWLMKGWEPDIIILVDPGSPVPLLFKLLI